MNYNPLWNKGDHIYIVISMQTQSYATEYNTYYKQRTILTALSSHPTYASIHHPIPKPPSPILKPFQKRNWQYPAHTLIHILYHNRHVPFHHIPRTLNNSNVCGIPSPPKFKHPTQQPTKFPHKILNLQLPLTEKKYQHHAQLPPPISPTPFKRKTFCRTICTSNKT